ncbi:MAG: hypothetical protein P4L35_15575 [Ignavibacteriaceae bacterium]|nr:hypothetical protein [Ignavibacteriaceae bacterium]
MSPEKAKKIALIWLSQSPKPNSLEVKEVVDVLQALGFTYIFVHHAKNKKSSILIGSVKVILKALSLHPDLKNE